MKILSIFKKILSIFKNRSLLLFSVIIFFYFYYMLLNFYTAILSPIASVCVFCIIGGSVVVMKKTLISGNILLKRFVFWFFWSLIICVIYFNTIGQTTSSVLWISGFLCGYYLIKSSDDLAIISLCGVLVCLLAIYWGISTLNVGNYIAYINVKDGDYDVSENISVFILITMPLVMLFNNRVLKWFILILTMIVVLMTARRTATICFVFVLALNIIQELRTSNESKGLLKRRVLPILIVAGVAYVIQWLLTGNFADALERTLSRFGEIRDDNGSGRSLLYADVWRSLSESNFLEIVFGHGYLGVNRVIGHTAAHNDFLEYLYDFGLIGLVFLVSLHVYVIKQIIMLYRRRHWLSFSYAASYCIFFFYGMFGNIIIYPQYFLTIPVYWGVAEKILLLDIKHE